MVGSETYKKKHCSHNQPIDLDKSVMANKGQSKQSNDSIQFVNNFLFKIRSGGLIVSVLVLYVTMKDEYLYDLLGYSASFYFYA